MKRNHKLSKNSVFKRGFIQHYFSFFKSKKSAGFTLIELMVVIAIIGVLSSVVLTSVDTAKMKARDSKRISEIRELMTALDTYYSVNGHYPISTGCGASSPPNGPNPSWCNSIETLSGGHWIKDSGTANVLSPYFNVEPTDPRPATSPLFPPVNGGTYFYYSAAPTSLGQYYIIVFGLERYPNALENIDGVTPCNGGIPHHYGSGINGVITISTGCSN